ncbi:MAG: cyanophycinase [Anaerolineales bacterium]|nr:cyanophycinase [Anaerolineales bacterium]
MQSFWDEAGSYGARILIVSTVQNRPATDQLREWFGAAEVDSLEVISIHERRDAMEPRLAEIIENATGIIVTDASPLRFTSLLGGTPVAQAIRRANARGRAVCGIGRGGAVLCQHMIAYDHRSEMPGPFLHRSLIQFAPGLVIINRVAFDCDEEPGSHFRTHLSRLLTAVAYNPFLVGIALDPDTGAVVYPNSTLEVFGAGSALIVDGWQITHTDLHEHQEEHPMSVLGAQLHLLSQGYTYNLDTHTPHRPPDTEIPRAGYEAYTSF